MFLRTATAKDVPALAELGRDSFVAAFGHLYRREDLAAFIEENRTPLSVGCELASSDNIYQLAEAEGKLLGYCKLSRASKFGALSTARNPIELGQLYTAPETTGRGIGASLMGWAITVAEAGRHDAILLSVYSGNHGAQRFYERYGFAKIADITFRVGEQLDHEYLFEKRLKGE